MPFLVRGGIVLDSVQLNTDPATYEPIVWERRYSEFMTISGGRTIQDFGVFQRDNKIRLQSGPTRPLEEAVVSALHSRYRTRGASFNMTDWLNNQFTVVITKFTAVPLKKGRDRTDGTTLSLYTYEMDLTVLVIVKLFNVAFTGP